MHPLINYLVCGDWCMYSIYVYLNAPALLKFVEAMLSKINAYMCVYECIKCVWSVSVSVCTWTVCVCLLGLFVVAHCVNFCYPQNSTSWVLSNLAALYWRVVGQGQLAIKCLKHSLYYSNEYTRVSQL